MKISAVLPAFTLVATLTLPACDGVKIGSRVKLPGVDISSTVEVGNPIWTGGAVTVTNRVVVGGVRYDGSAAAITMDGRSASYSQLKSGQILSLHGKLNADRESGTADDIVQQTTVIGPLDAVDPVHRTLVVMGQLIRVATDTHFGIGIDPLLFTGLDVGATVAVNGLFSSLGEVHATRVERGGAGAPFQVIGRVSGLDAHNLLFRMQGLTVNYGEATFIDVPETAFTTGTLVFVRGHLAQGIFVAQEVRTPIAAYSSRWTGDYTRPRATLTFDNRDFDELDLAGVVNATLVGNADYGVMVKVDERATDRLSVTQSGARVSIGLQDAADDTDEALEVTVSLPLLQRLRLSGVANVTLTGFDQEQMDAATTGIASFTGLDLRIGHLTLKTTGVSYVNFADTAPLASAEMILEGISEVTLNLDQGASITGSLDGLSQLLYYGNDVDASIVAGTPASLRRLGDTRY